jgi:Domain of unknown function (DUF4371)/hAT family C-terminal dimerisation region
MSVRKQKKQCGAFYRNQKIKNSEEQSKLKGALIKFLETNKNQGAPSSNVSLHNLKNIPFATSVSVSPNPINLDSENVAPNDPGIDVDIETSSTSSLSAKACTSNISLTSLSSLDKFDFDPSKWPTILTDKYRQLIVEKGPLDISSNFSFPTDVNGRRFSLQYLYMVLSNGERIKRTWLVYSVLGNKIYCFCCKIFSNLNTKFITGYNDWKNLSNAIVHHEKNISHLKSFNSWTELINRKRLNKTIDAEYERLLHSESQYWREVFERLTEIILTLTQLNLPFRGKSDVVYEKSNGVFLKIVECVGLYDPILKEHLRRITAKETNVHYLSKDIQNELIGLLAQKTKAKIIEMAKKAEFFSVILDTTPDISHKEQLTMIIRFVNTDSINTHLVEEHFVGFLEVDDTSGSGLASKFLDELEHLGLDIKNCRGQGYDNGANMRGKNNGLQRQILNINSRAFFVPCSCHSMNLVINDAAESNIEMVNFFSTVQSMYNFFSASTHRWSVLLKHLPGLTLKSLSSTRWESRINAIRAIRFQLGFIYDAFIDLIDDQSLTGSHGNKTKSDAKNLVHKIKNFQFVCSAVLWYNVLLETNRVNILMQSPSFSICAAAEIIESAVNNLKKLRSDEEFQTLFIEARVLADSIDLEPKFVEVRIKKRTRNFDYEVRDDPMEDSIQKFKVDVYFNLLDIAINSTEERFLQLSNYNKTFGFLHSIQKLSSWKQEDISTHCKNLEIALSDNSQKDIDGVQLTEELVFISNLLKPSNRDSPNDVLKYIINDRLIPIFPNLYIALKILLTLPVSVASGERSFSRLKLIKNYLRSTMTQDRLSGLSILSIENDISRSLNKEDILRDFCNLKARKKL